MGISSSSVDLFSQLLRSGGSELAHEQEVQKGHDVKELRELGLLEVSKKTFPAVKLTLKLPSEEIKWLKEAYTSGQGLLVKKVTQNVPLSRIKEWKDLGLVRVVKKDGVATLFGV